MECEFFMTMHFTWRQCHISELALSIGDYLFFCCGIICGTHQASRPAT